MAVKSEVRLSTISYVILYVNNADKTKKFYTDTLGMKIKVDSPDWVELESGSTTLALHSDSKHTANKKTEGFPIVVFNVDDIYGTYEALKAKGVKFDKEPEIVCEQGDQVGKSCSFQDPDGNLLSIYGLVKK